MTAEERAAPSGVMPTDGHHKAKPEGRSDTRGFLRGQRGPLSIREGLWPEESEARRAKRHKKTPGSISQHFPATN
jgi:hypothetical protein